MKERERGEENRKTHNFHGEPALHVEVLPPAPDGGFEQTCGRGEDEERRGNEKDQSKYPAKCHHQYHCKAVRGKGYLQKDRSSRAVAPYPGHHGEPALHVVGRSEKTRSLGRCPGSSPLFETDPETEPDDTIMPGAHDETGPTDRNGTEGQRPGPPTQPGHQETSARKRAHRQAGEPGSFPHVSVRLEGRDSGGTTAFSRVPVLISRLRHHAEPARESFTGPTSDVYGRQHG